MFSEKQEQVLDFPYSDYQAIICDGSVRSGKTVSMIISFIASTMNKFNNQNFALCSKTVKTCQRNIIKVLMSIRYFHMEFSMQFKQTESLLTVKRGNKINYYYVFGGKDESSYQLIQGITLAGAFFDEVALMPESFVNQATARCSIEKSQFWFNCNPESPNNWFYINWVKQAELHNALYLHFTMDDNPSLSDEIKQRYETMYTGVFYQRYIKGLWVKAEGLIYEEFASNPEDYIYDDLPKNITFIQVGVDFGGTKSGTSFVATGFCGLKAIVVIESERHLELLDPVKLENLYIEFCDKVYTKYKKAFVTRADSAEQVLIRGLENAVERNNTHTEIYNAQKTSILGRIKALNRLMAQGRFHVMRRCKSVIQAISNAVWDSKHEDVRLDDGTSDIDTMDALEYTYEEYIDELVDVS